jgi:predicted LPLAT superfamily acyltransferase
MQSVNTMRAVLVGSAVLAALIATALGFWLVGVILLVGVAAHAAMWVYLRRLRGDRPTA